MTEWDISTAVHVQARSVSAEEGAPTGVFFKPDGTKMYIIGYAGDEVNEYNLSTPWDISSETHVQARSVAAEESTPTGIFFKSDGTKMYIVGYNDVEVNEYTLSTPWDVSSETHVQARDVSAEELYPMDIFFKSDGSTMFLVGTNGDDVNEYSLSTPWDISSETHVGSRSVAAEETFPSGVFFSPDGSKMYIVGNGGDEVNEYTLSTPWDVSSETHVHARSVSAEEANPRGIFFKSDGSTMWIIGIDGDEVNEYSLLGRATHNSRSTMSVHPGVMFQTLTGGHGY
jgi:DNA-binding beta-propeller fold protein YncE